ncbi:hypothetical protein B0H14DRAFT_3745814 [Mycena olivaceomarginata]|nr:hypothetical protein B0H14DRAFT_3745814 [Mycena olivaceomarginata]
MAANLPLEPEPPSSFTGGRDSDPWPSSLQTTQLPFEPAPPSSFMGGRTTSSTFWVVVMKASIAIGLTSYEWGWEGVLSTSTKLFRKLSKPKSPNSQVFFVFLMWSVTDHPPLFELEYLLLSAERSTYPNKTCVAVSRYKMLTSFRCLRTHPSTPLILTKSKSMDSFTTAKKIEDVVLPPVNEDGGTGSTGSCVVCKEDGSLPTINEDGGTGSSGSCVIA